MRVYLCPSYQALPPCSVCNRV